MPLSVNDQMWFDDSLGTVVAVTDTTDANGRGSISYGGNDFYFRALKCTPADGVDYPLIATSDSQFRVGLVENSVGAGAPTYALCLDDGPAPTGWGRDVGGNKKESGWLEASSFADTDSVIFYMGWRPGKLTVKKGGVLQTNQAVDFMLVYSTDQGAAEAWWEPVGAIFKTDGDGIVERVAPGGNEPVIVPKGMAAIGHRVGDGWPSSPQPERVLASLRMYYLQEWVEVTEGDSAELDIAAVSVTVNGPPQAKYRLLWEGGWSRPDALRTLDGAGADTVTGIVPGRYTCALYHPSDKTKYLHRQSFDAEDSGGSYIVTFSGSWSTVTTGQWAGRVYAYGSTPAVGAEVWEFVEVPPDPGGWVLRATVDANGDFSISNPGAVADLIIRHDQWGAVAINTQAIGSTLWIDPQLAGHFCAMGEISLVPPEEGVTPWVDGGSNVNLPPPARPGYMQSPQGEQFWFGSASLGRGVVTEPAPRWTWSPSEGPPPLSPTLIEYDFYSADGTLLQADVTLPGRYDGLWADNAVWRRQSTIGSPVRGIVGGKAQGSIILADRSTEITQTSLPEAARLGLEFGRYAALEARLTSETLPEGTAAALGFTDAVCENCDGAVWWNPDGGGYTRGRCVSCDADMRSFFRSPTVAALDDWQARIARNMTTGMHNDRQVEGHPRPEEYARTGAYQATFNGQTRYVATHIVLGAWNNGAFVDGESIADAEARLGRTVGPVMLKFELTADYYGVGQTLRFSCTRPDGQSEYRTVTIPSGSSEGDLFPLHWRPHHYYPQGYYTEVTLIETLAGDGALYGRVVNDGPAYHSRTGIAADHQAYTPYATDVALSSRDPFLREDFAGRLHLVYVREGHVMHRTLEGTSSAWGSPTNVTLRAGWAHPCREPNIAPLPHAELVVAGHTRGTTRLWRSRDDGGNWD